MKLLKNPVIAIILAAVIIIASTLISIDVKLDNKCQEIVDGFYTGIEYEGEYYPSAAGAIKELIAVSDALIPIANNYGIKTAALNEHCEELKLSMNYSGYYVSYIYYEFTEFYAELKSVEEQLHTNGLSTRHQEMMLDYSRTITSAAAAIENSHYNDTVWEFRQKFDRFPVSIWIDLLWVELPEYFA